MEVSPLDKLAEINERYNKRVSEYESIVEEINKKHKQLEESNKKINTLIELKNNEYLEKLAEVQKGLENPEESIDILYKNVKNRTSLLNQELKELQVFREKIKIEESDIQKKENILRDGISILRELEKDFWKVIGDYYNYELVTLKNRADMIEKREEQLKVDRNLLNDQKRSFQAARREILSMTK